MSALHSTDHPACSRWFHLCRPWLAEIQPVHHRRHAGIVCESGCPAPEIAAPVIPTLELVGGIALIVGVLARIFAALLIPDMLGALVLVHAPAGIFVSGGGFELVLILATAALVVVLAGPGRFSVDHALFGRSRSRLKVLA